MEGFELGSERKRGVSGPGSGAAGAAVIILVFTSVAYAATRSILTTGLFFVALVLFVVLADRVYDRYVG